MTIKNIGTRPTTQAHAKSKPRFMTGYNAGSRHVALGYVPDDFHMHERSNDFKAGYEFGKLDRAAGKLMDNDSATKCINAAWHIYANGGAAPAPTIDYSMAVPQ